MPLLYRQEGPKQAQMAVWQITESEEELINRLSFCTSMDRQLQPISNPAKRLEWLASRLLIQELLQCPPALSYSVNGKPHMTERDVHLSISHTSGFAAVVVSPQKPTGIDIEYPSPRIEKLSARFVNATEERQFPLCGREKGCALVWCAKETLYKIMDTPGVLFKEDMEIEGLSPHSSGTLKARVNIQDQWLSLVLQYRITPEYYLVWYW
jgi:4'-phosphopantetheinyl transferase EntD